MQEPWTFSPRRASPPLSSVLTPTGEGHPAPIPVATGSVRLLSLSTTEWALLGASLPLVHVLILRLIHLILCVAVVFIDEYTCIMYYNIFLFIFSLDNIWLFSVLGYYE